MVAKGLVVPGDLVIELIHIPVPMEPLSLLTGVGSTELAAAMISGQLWFKVPETILIRINGTLPPGVYSKDVILYLASQIGADGATYQAIEFTGPIIDRLSVEERLTISNMAVELGAKAGIIAPDEKTLTWVKQRTIKSFEPIYPDPDAVYLKELTYDCSTLTPQVALPHRVDTVTSIDSLGEVIIQEAYLGTCTNGRSVDIEVAAKILQDKKVHPKVRLIVAPASKEILLEAIEKGWIETIVKAGGVLVTPGCGPCVGTHQGVPGDGWNVVSTANRNFKGRTTTATYLAFSYRCLLGFKRKITDPRKYLR